MDITLSMNSFLVRMHRVHLLPLLLHLVVIILVKSRLLRSIKTKYSASAPGSAPPPAQLPDGEVPQHIPPQAVPVGDGRKVLDTGSSENFKFYTLSSTVLFERKNRLPSDGGAGHGYGGGNGRAGATRVQGGSGGLDQLPFIASLTLSSNSPI